MASLDSQRFVKGPKAYTSVQCGRGQKDHIELNSDLAYSEMSKTPHRAELLSLIKSTIPANRMLSSIYLQRTLTIGILGRCKTSKLGPRVNKGFLCRFRSCSPFL